MKEVSPARLREMTETIARGLRAPAGSRFSRLHPKMGESVRGATITDQLCYPGNVFGYGEEQPDVDPAEACRALTIAIRNHRLNVFAVPPKVDNHNFMTYFSRHRGVVVRGVFGWDSLGGARLRFDIIGGQVAMERNAKKGGAK